MSSRPSLFEKKNAYGCGHTVYVGTRIMFWPCIVYRYSIFLTPGINLVFSVTVIDRRINVILRSKWPFLESDPNGIPECPVAAKIIYDINLLSSNHPFTPVRMNRGTIDVHCTYKS